MGGATGRGEWAGRMGGANGRGDWAMRPGGARWRYRSLWGRLGNTTTNAAAWRTCRAHTAGITLLSGLNVNNSGTIWRCYWSIPECKSSYRQAEVLLVTTVLRPRLPFLRWKCTAWEWDHLNANILLQSYAPPLHPFPFPPPHPQPLSQTQQREGDKVSSSLSPEPRPSQHTGVWRRNESAHMWSALQNNAWKAPRHLWVYIF